jgi:sulfur carrier protein ThiS adenylyltransferase
MPEAEIRRHLMQFTVGIAGAGGLGSNCAVALARSGVGTLVIADFDVVESSNLSRQYYFRGQEGMFKTEALRSTIERIDPGIRVISHVIRVDRDNIKDLFSGCDVIVEAFDRAEMKAMITETVQKSLPHIPLVLGSGLAGWGKSNEIKCRKIDDTLYICGDESTEVTSDLPPLAPRVGIVACMQANMVISILMNRS